MLPSRNANVDSLIANEFKVQIDDQPLTGVFGLSGLVTFKSESADDGGKAAGSFTLTKMVQRDPKNAFNSWLIESRNGQGATRSVAIIAVDDGIPTRRWLARGAKIKSVSYSDFDVASFEMVAEIVEISFDEMTEEFLTNG